MKSLSTSCKWRDKTSAFFIWKFLLGRSLYSKYVYPIFLLYINISVIQTTDSLLTHMTVVCTDLWPVRLTCMLIIQSSREQRSILRLFSDLCTTGEWNFAYFIPHLSSSATALPSPYLWQTHLLNVRIFYSMSRLTGKKSTTNKGCFEATYTTIFSLAVFPINDSH